MRSGSDVQVTALVMEIHPPAMLFRGRVLHSAVDIDAPPMPTASRKREMPRSDNPRPTNTRQTETGLRSTPRRNSSFESPSLFFLSLSFPLALILVLFLPRSTASQKSGLLSYYEGGAVLKAAPLVGSLRRIKAAGIHRYLDDTRVTGVQEECSTSLTVRLT